MATKLSQKEKEVLRTGAINMVRLFEKYQKCETYEDFGRINTENEKEGKSNWFKNWDSLFNKINKAIQ
jgi:uncharacterized beta-barrel protein YwiB (DUF1934 family)